jgi:hypothetical protein
METPKDELGGFGKGGGADRGDDCRVKPGVHLEPRPQRRAGVEFAKQLEERSLAEAVETARKVAQPGIGNSGHCAPQKNLGARGLAEGYG